MSFAPSPLRARLLLLTAAALFSTGGAAIKACSLTPWQVACLRSFVAGTAIFLLLPGARRGWSAGVFGVGAAYAGTMILFVWANKLTTAAETIFLQDTAPIFIMLLSPWLLSEKARARDGLMIAVMACGLAFFFADTTDSSPTAPNRFAGNCLALLSSLTWALTIMGLRKLRTGRTAARERTHGPAMTAVLCGNLLTAIGLAPLAFPVESLGPTDAALIVWLGLFQIGAAYFCLARGLRGVRAAEASVLMLVEPALSPLWAFLLLGERLGVWAAAGACIVLTATVGQTLLGWRDSAAVLKPDAETAPSSVGGKT
jgi:drug/metabolite transporter (DMT)-like permease